MDLLLSAISQGLLWGVLSLGLFISFRILNLADMTTEGAFPLGASVCVLLIQQGVPPLLATVSTLVAGGVAGLVTACLILYCKVPSLLAGILTMTGLLSINLRVMGRPNLSLMNHSTIFTPFEQWSLPAYFDGLFVGLLVVVLLIALYAWFFHTELGQALIATGDNAAMARAFGVSTNRMLLLGLVLSNAIIALAGGILAQYNGYADVNSGIGTIVIALAAIIIGEVVFGDVSFTVRLVCIIFGSIIYRLLLMGVLLIGIFQPNDFKLISAGMIAICLSLPQIRSMKWSKGGRA